MYILCIQIATGYTVRSGLSKPIYLNNVNCVENEFTLLDCSYEQMNDANENDHSKDIGVKCTLCKCSHNNIIATYLRNLCDYC